MNIRKQTIKIPYSFSFKTHFMGNPVRALNKFVQGGGRTNFSRAGSAPLTGWGVPLHTPLNPV